MERFAVFVSVCVYVCLCMGGRLQLVMRGYGEQCSALRLAIEFLVRAHWETAVFGQILAGRPREVTGAHFCHWRPLGRRLNSSSGIIGKGPFWVKVWPGGNGRSREVIGGYGRLRAVTERENGEQWRKSRKRVGDTLRKRTEMSSVKCRGGSVEWKVLCRV